jgi:hypothetical protein
MAQIFHGILPETFMWWPTLAAHSIVRLFLALLLTAMATAAALKQVEPGLGKVAPELAEQFVGFGVADDLGGAGKRAHETLLKLLAALHREGVTLVIGTDQAVPGHSLQP